MGTGPLTARQRSDLAARAAKARDPYMFQGICPAPDSGFMRKLREFDPKLDCIFNRWIHRFVIVREQTIGPPAQVWLVETSTGAFRQPDSRDLRALFGGDLHRVSPEERERKALAQEAEYSAREQKNESEDIRNATKDDKIQLANAYTEAFNLGKVSAFRRVEVKPKGYKVVDKRKLQAEGTAECMTGKELPDTDTALSGAAEHPETDQLPAA